jgi:predicted KAP-like P-loop ATPase
MTDNIDYADLPISTPDQDLYGIDAFVKSLAQSVRTMKTPQGVVIALNGPWGSGKSSAINLLKHHLQEAVSQKEIEIVTFNPWWFRGEEALVLAFFRELYAATKPNLTSKAKKVLPKLGARLLKAGGAVGSAADALGAGGAGSIASGTMDWLSGLITDEESVEKLHQELATGLADQKKRFIVVIDDIDRLAPDEAMAMFRLVKSVGRLPNVIYVLAFDRTLAERAVAERFPSEGPHYLEKIVQASFELPDPLASDLQNQVISKICEIAGQPEERLVVHFMNLFHEIVSPEINTPRDAIRFTNALSITWPAVAGEVDLADFIALEAYRLFRPAIHQAIRRNQTLLCGAASISMGRPQTTAEQLDALLLSSVPDPELYRKGLMRLFPKLKSIWANTYGDMGRFVKQRRACVAEFFPTYFRLSLSDDVVPRSEINAIISHAADQEWIRDKLLLSVQETRRGGGTRAAPILDALSQNAEDVSIDDVASLLSAIFSIADELDVEADEAGAFSFGNNSLRIHWLLRSLTRDRTDLTQRSVILMKAARNASLGWQVDLANSAWGDYNPREGEEPQSEGDRLVTESDLPKLTKLALDSIKRAAKDGTLLNHNDLPSLLYRWRNFANDGGAAAKRWTSARLKDDRAVARLAAAFTSYSWGQSSEDLVAKRSDRAQISGLDEIMDVALFRKRLEALETSLPKGSEDHDAISRFLKAWDNKNRFGD